LIQPQWVTSRHYTIPLDGHVFPIDKFERITELLIKDGVCIESEIIEPDYVSEEVLRLVHQQDYWDDFKNLRWTQRTEYSELPLNRDIVNLFLLSVGGSVKAAELALMSHLGIHIGGGFHHAFPDHAEGFCYLNDVAVAIRKLQRDKLAKRFFIIDCDVHQGNGTACIFRNAPDVFTFSIHQENLYPHKEKSTLDVGLTTGIKDKEYLLELKKYIPSRLDTFKPDLVIYVAGADIYEEDLLGGLKITKAGILQRDEWVIQSVFERKVPLMIVLAGGYAKDSRDTVQIQFNTCLKAAELAKLFEI